MSISYHKGMSISYHKGMSISHHKGMNIIKAKKNHFPTSVFRIFASGPLCSGNKV